MTWRLCRPVGGHHPAWACPGSAARDLTAGPCFQAPAQSLLPRGLIQSLSLSEPVSFSLLKQVRTKCLAQATHAQGVQTC